MPKKFLTRDGVPTEVIGWRQHKAYSRYHLYLKKNARELYWPICGLPDAAHRGSFALYWRPFEGDKCKTCEMLEKKYGLE